MNRYELNANYDARKSFYGKAIVEDDGTALRLYSYLTHVATFHKGTRELALMAAWDHSGTTLRHVKEFMKQNRLETGTKSDIAKRYVS